MVCDLGEEERTKIRKKKKEKKRKKTSSRTKVGWLGIGMKGYLKTYNHMKYFLPYLTVFD